MWEVLHSMSVFAACCTRLLQSQSQGQCQLSVRLYGLYSTMWEGPADT